MSTLPNAIAALPFLLFGTPSIGQTVGDSTIGGGVSIFGATFETTYQLAPDTRLRGVIMGGLGYDATEEDDDGNSYEIDIDLAASGVLFDYYPNNTGWRISGGLILDLSDATGVGTGAEQGTFEVNGETFEGGEVLAEARFRNRLSPIVTAGYDYDLGNGWILSGEAGAIYTGGIETEFTANSRALQDAIDADEEFRDTIQDADDIKFLPYLSVIVSFRF